MIRVAECDLCGQPRCVESFCFRLQCYRKNGMWFDARNKLVRWVKKGRKVVNAAWLPEAWEERNVGVAERQGVTTPMSDLTVAQAQAQGTFDWKNEHRDPTA